MLKKILLYSLFTFMFAFKSNAQGKIIIDYTKYDNWVQCGESGYGRSSFYVGISREYVNELYYYKIYLYNNSFNANGFEVPTYLEGITVYAYTLEHGLFVWKNVINVEYALIKPKTPTYDGQYYLGYVYSGDVNQTIKITWNNIHNY